MTLLICDWYKQCSKYSDWADLHENAGKNSRTFQSPLLKQYLTTDGGSELTFFSNDVSTVLESVKMGTACREREFPFNISWT